MSTPDGTLNPSKSTKNPKPITPSSEFATEGSTYTPSTPSTVSFTSELTTASSSGNLSHKDYTPVIYIFTYISYPQSIYHSNLGNGGSATTTSIPATGNFFLTLPL